MAEDPQKGGPQDGGTQLVTERRTRLKRPNRYKVVLLNDDYTPMEFVVWLLVTVFHRSEADSRRLMLQIHTKGKGVCGTYSHDVARTKLFQVQSLAEKNGHPLQAVLEAAGPEE